ncbi:DNA-binding protein [Sulfurimonas sp.]
MPNMTIIEAAEHFGVSKEAIHNRVRRGSLNVVVVDGVKLVEVDSKAKVTTQTRAKAQSRRVPHASDDKYYKLLEEQNAKLQDKVEKLEGETRTLRDQKEEMLVQERIKIEQIYKDKDEQLKNILSTISSQFMLNAPSAEEEDEHLDAEIEVKEEKPQSVLVSLKKYLKEQGYSEKKQDKIKKKFKKRANKDDRIIILGKKYYINPVKYDYKDLI